VWEQHPAKQRAEPEGFRHYFDEGLASGGALVAIDRADGRVIGWSRFAAPDPATGEVEIGWTFLARSHWGGAYNSEMKALMLRHAFQSVSTVIFRVDAGNLRSQRAVQKLGAAHVRTEPDSYGSGEHPVFALHASDWED
jgi:RimJ/RimL family protein N-acetyltransferase